MRSWRNFKYMTSSNTNMAMKIISSISRNSVRVLEFTNVKTSAVRLKRWNIMNCWTITEMNVLSCSWSARLVGIQPHANNIRSIKKRRASKIYWKIEISNRRLLTSSNYKGRHWWTWFHLLVHQRSQKVWSWIRMRVHRIIIIRFWNKGWQMSVP